MKKIITSTLALAVAGSLYAQTLNMDMSPITSSLRSVIPDAINIACVALLIIGVTGVVMKYYEEKDKLTTGIIAVLLFVAILWAVGKIAVNAFL